MEVAQGMENAWTQMFNPAKGVVQMSFDPVGGFLRTRIDGIKMMKEIQNQATQMFFSKKGVVQMSFDSVGGFPKPKIDGLKMMKGMLLNQGMKQQEETASLPEGTKPPEVTKNEETEVPTAMTTRKLESRGNGVRGIVSIWTLFVVMMMLPSMASALNCPEGTHLYKFHNGHHPDVCVECQPKSFMPAINHQQTQCRPCEQIEDPKLEILVSPCNKTHDAIIHCVEGYYRDLARNPRETGTCQKCTKCLDYNMYTGQPCGTYRDSVCCLNENFDVAPNHHGVPLCRERPWFCRRGQYFETDGFRCLPCPTSTFMPLDYHVRPECFKCRDYTTFEVNRPLHSVVVQPCNSTHDTVLRCKDGFFMNLSLGFLNDSLGCSPCTDCSTTDVHFEGRKCDSMGDTMCCPQINMTVVDTLHGPMCKGPSSICRREECLWYRSWKGFSNCAACDSNIDHIDVRDDRVYHHGDESERRKEPEGHACDSPNSDSVLQSQSSRASQQSMGDGPIASLVIFASLIAKGISSGTDMAFSGIFIYVLVLPHVASSPTCPPGAYLHTFPDNRPDICVECPDGTYMPYNGHQHTECLACEEIENLDLEIWMSPCNKINNAVINCVEGYYRHLAGKPGDKGKCLKCKECSEHDKFTGQPCSTYRDTICCMDENFDVVFNQHGDPECIERPWFCRRGQYFEPERSTYRCLPCPSNTFMPSDYHVLPECLKCRNYDEYESYRPRHSIIVQPCNSTHDTVLGCKDGYFMKSGMGIANNALGCSPCTDCSTTDALYEGRKCDSMEDTVCCSQANMTVVDTPDGPVCEARSRNGDPDGVPHVNPTSGYAHRNSSSAAGHDQTSKTLEQKNDQGLLAVMLSAVLVFGVVMSVILVLILLRIKTPRQHLPGSNNSLVIEKNGSADTNQVTPMLNSDSGGFV